MPSYRLLLVDCSTDILNVPDTVLWPNGPGKYTLKLSYLAVKNASIKPVCWEYSLAHVNARPVQGVLMDPEQLMVSQAG